MDSYGLCYWYPIALSPLPGLIDLARAAASRLAPATVLVAKPMNNAALAFHRPSTAHESRQRHRDIGDRNFR